MGWLKYLLAAGLLVLIPSDALAWGPAAHLDFGLHLLRDLALVAPAVAGLLRRFPDDFLYGNLAADITIGKNFSPYYLHCHNWQVGLSVLDLAEEDATRSFAWGYLSHLAADIVAHNYFIPYKLVQYYQRRRAPHAYWELRFDTHMSRDAWTLARKLANRSFRDHDRHLRRILTGPLFSFGVNKQLFHSMVLFNQIFTWKRMVEAHNRRSSLVLTRDEVEEMFHLSMEQIMSLLGDGRRAACLNADPTGHRNILIARDLRKRMRKLHLEGRLLQPDNIGALYKPLFRDALHSSKLSLPSMIELIDHQAPPKPDKARKADKPAKARKRYHKPDKKQRKLAKKHDKRKKKQQKKQHKQQRKQARKTRRARKTKSSP